MSGAELPDTLLLMAVAVATGDKGKCDKIFSRIIRFYGMCENCDYVCPHECSSREGTHKKGCKLQCAHLISRHLSATRCDVRNAFALCAKCHYFFGNWPLEFSTFVLANRTEAEYNELRTRAQAGGAKINWTVELERLDGIWRDLREQWDC